MQGDKLYAVGGYDGQQYLNEVECYEPQTNDWHRVSYIRGIYINGMNRGPFSPYVVCVMIESLPDF